MNIIKVPTLSIALLWVLILFAAVHSIAGAAVPLEKDSVDGSDENIVLKVGLREDAKPFSYRIKTSSSETIFPGFGGYVVEVCRQVLHKMKKQPGFRKLKVEAVVLEASERFKQLRSGQIDMLCGPDSITKDRLDQFYVSHPIFLSGMTYGYIDPSSSLFPGGSHCKNIVGVVNGTTAESDGLEDLSRSDLLLRFDEALDLEIEKTPERLQMAKEAYIVEAAKSGCFDETWLSKVTAGSQIADVLDHLPDTGTVGKIRSKIADHHFRINGQVAREITTQECPAGFTGLPIRRYPDHQKGIKAFCEGKVLFYLGDYDIISEKIKEVSHCQVRLNRLTRSREVYGIFFGKTIQPNLNPTIGALENSSCSTAIELRENPLNLSKELIYAAFNNVLYDFMQGTPSPVEEVFIDLFGIEKMSDDLAAFFSGFKMK